MIVVGLTGGMGQGKSTVGQMLRELAKVDYKADLESSYPITTVANQWLSTWPQSLVLAANETQIQLANRLIESLPPIIEEVTGKSTTAKVLQINEADSANVTLHKRLLDYIGQWLEESEGERHDRLPLPIVPQNKALHRALFQWLGGMAIELIYRPIWSDLLDKRIKQLAERDYKLVTVGGIRYDHDADMIQANKGVILKVMRPHSAHSSDVTETSMSEVEADIVLHNDGTLAQLEWVVRQLWQDLQVGKPQAEYRASLIA